VRLKQWWHRGGGGEGGQPKPVRGRAGFPTAARGPCGSIQHDGTQGHQAGAKSEEGATHVGRIRQQRARSNGVAMAWTSPHQHGDAQ
jgi:hypothetical protein